MYRLVYCLNGNLYKKYFDNFEELYYFINLGFIVNKSFYVYKIYDINNKEFIYE